MVNDFIDWILEEMAARDWSQAEMARRTGLSATLISNQHTAGQARWTIGGCSTSLLVL